MSTRIRMIGAAAILFSVLSPLAGAEMVSVLGPIEAVSADGQSIVVLGQVYQLEPKAFSRRSAAGTFPEDDPRLLPIGTLVAVHGERNSNGVQIATSLRIFESQYVPGATDIYLLGVAATYDAAIAVVAVGSTRVFIGDIDGEVAQALNAGSSLEIVGRQSQPGGLVWATAIRVVRAEPAVSAESTTPEIALQSITGTGFSTQSITGTGKSTQSITGTGVSAQSITGTGVNVQSITGTGKSTQSITGTGKSTQSITGTGVSAQSITGTGVNVQSITGTGKSTQSITGTGADA